MKIFEKIKNNIGGKLEWLFVFAILLGIICGSYVISRKIVTQETEANKVEAGTIDVILDAGHGGADPGEIGINDALEKDINLAIVLKIEKLLSKDGYQVVLTRTEDALLDKNGQEYSKTEDMRTRVKIINEMRPKIVVSVHQNSYPSGDVKGAQVFYYTTSPEGEKIAQIMQEAVRQIDPSNNRQIKANDTYYMLKRTEVPTIIVECGFLTNWEEANKLIDEGYQGQMAAAITEGIKSCLEEN